MATQVSLLSGAVASAGSLLLQTNGTTTQATIDTSGNLGLGVTPSAWGSPFKAFQFGASGGALNYRTDSNQAVELSLNWFYDGTNSKYINSNWATRYRQFGGAHEWYTAASGTAGNAITFTQAMTLDASGRLGIGTTNPSAKLEVTHSGGTLFKAEITNVAQLNIGNGGSSINYYDGDTQIFRSGAGTERARIDSSGNLLVGTTSTTVGSGGSGVIGFRVDGANGIVQAAASSNPAGIFNRTTSDGVILSLRQDGSEEGTISVSGTTVSYNGGHLARYAQTIGAKDESLRKGTVLSNLDEMNTYTDAEGNPVENEQLNKVKVSDVEGDANVAGVFVNWSYDEQHSVDEINMAMTGDMIIRIAQGTTVSRGDLLMSAGNGTAKPQGDDIVRAKTIAKVTSTHVTCTYEDGSYCVPCVLMAC